MVKLTKLSVDISLLTLKTNEMLMSQFEKDNNLKILELFGSFLDFKTRVPASVKSLHLHISRGQGNGAIELSGANKNITELHLNDAKSIKLLLSTQYLYSSLRYLAISSGHLSFEYFTTYFNPTHFKELAVVFLGNRQWISKFSKPFQSWNIHLCKTYKEYCRLLTQ
ncbi:hypothetical protein RFI_09036 [Reticulomyxa filosa]|uniref:Uncharacterized protein n=1 Tax=Reticulomyxa filosa TaxID=46433 RepID=X6NQV4_RETFI|nr:hypothetical protein RFI_09036 [Reticulomyxa filosa]|eukprot:ETO28094.1 hypothetical protein RFI_09036 [Reticulomyxa filosa]